MVNGTWNDGTSDDVVLTLSGYEGDTLKFTSDQIPAAGTKPSKNYKAGSWDASFSSENELMKDTTYTYTYKEKDKISQTVTFKVVNGAWDDGTTADKIVTLNGYEGDTLALKSSDIPSVVTKPADSYKAGKWDIVPSSETEITEKVTYTYEKKSDTTPNNKKADVTPGNKKAAKNDAPGTGDAVNVQLIFPVMVLSMCDIFALCNLRSILEEKKRRR